MVSLLRYGELLVSKTTFSLFFFGLSSFMLYFTVTVHNLQHEMKNFVVELIYRMHPGEVKLENH